MTRCGASTACRSAPSASEDASAQRGRHRHRAALLIVELVYVPKRVISPIYGLDGAIEAGFIVAWAACLLG